MTQAWEPANAVEQALTEAVARDERAEFFRILTTAQLYLPQLAEDDGDGGQAFLTGEMLGQTMLPVFTSVEALLVGAGAADAYTLTSYQELREKWPDPRWKLAVNPGSPIDAYLPVEAVAAAAAGELAAMTMTEAAIEAVAEAEDAAGLVDAEEAMWEAAEQGDADGYLAALLDAMVWVPLEQEVAEPDLAALAAGLPWRLVPGAAEPTLQVFTSEESLAEAFPEPVPEVMVPFAVLLSVWPQGHALSVNPGTDLNVELPADQLPLLALVALAGDDEDDDDEVGDEVGEVGEDDDDKRGPA